MTQNNDNIFSLTVERAASRLAPDVTLSGILQYAATLHDPDELKAIKAMLSQLFLQGKGRKSDALECIRFVQTLINDCYRPQVITQQYTIHEQHNSQCMQMFGADNMPH